MDGQHDRGWQRPGSAGGGYRRPMGILRMLGWSVVALAVALAATSAAAQTPLEDVVPLAEFEVRNDDLIRLATAYVDALRDLKNAKLSLSTLSALRPNAVITNLELQIATINAETAEQKLRLLQAIAEKLLAAAEARLEMLRRMEQLGEKLAAPAADETRDRVQITQAEATVKILKMLLQTK